MMAENVDYDKLAVFLSRICPEVLTELDKMHRSRAFDGYEPIEDNTDAAVRKLHTLQVSNINSQSEVLLCAVFVYVFIYGLFNYAVSSLHYIASDDRILMNNKLEGIWKQAVMA
jgi:hypothetical protein